MTGRVTGLCRCFGCKSGSAVVSSAAAVGLGLGSRGSGDGDDKRGRAADRQDRPFDWLARVQRLNPPPFPA